MYVLQKALADFLGHQLLLQPLAGNDRKSEVGQLGAEVFNVDGSLERRPIDDDLGEVHGDASKSWRRKLRPRMRRRLASVTASSIVRVRTLVSA